MRRLPFLVLLLWISGVFSAAAPSGETTLQGWLADETCARGRASSGVYTATGPRCAKECVAKGKKIVLVEPDSKQILLIVNQSAARSYVGDHVQIAGTVDPKAGTLRVASVKLLAKGVAMCSRK